MPATSAQPAEPAARRRLTAEQRRHQIFDASCEVIAAKGYATATLTEIADRAGVAKGLLWHYFQDRDDLMTQTLIHLAGQIREVVVTGLDLTASVPEVILGVLASTALLTRTHPAQLEAIDQIVHNLRNPDGRQRVTVHDYDATYQEHEQLLTRGQAENSIRPGDVRVMAVSYQGVIDAMIGYLQIHHDVDPHRYSAAVADLLLTGISNP